MGCVEGGVVEVVDGDGEVVRWIKGRGVWSVTCV